MWACKPDNPDQNKHQGYSKSEIRRKYSFSKNIQEINADESPRNHINTYFTNSDLQPSVKEQFSDLKPCQVERKFENSRHLS